MCGIGGERVWYRLCVCVCVCACVRVVDVVYKQGLSQD